MVRIFKKAINLVKIFIAAVIVGIKDERIGLMWWETVKDVYYLRKILTDRSDPVDIYNRLTFINMDLEILRTKIQASGFKCLEEVTKDVIWQYDIFTNKLKAIKVE